MNLIDSLIKDGWLKTPEIIKAFQKIKRNDFLPENMKDMAEINEALPIGYAQTISQPLTVAFMMELLSPKKGEKILDIGSGSGWTASILSEIVGDKGKVIAIEIIPKLKEFGEKNASKYSFVKKGTIEFIQADGSKGYPKFSFDKILCSASVQKQIPKAWKKQLKIGGKIVTSVGSSIWLLEKKTKKEFKETEYPGFLFVPLIEK